MARVLIVDDDVATRTILRDVLELGGHVVVLACDGSEALSKIKGEAFDLVLMDRSMPQMDGIQAVHAIRTQPRFKTLKIIMVTSASVVKEVDEAFQAGADDYIVKPVDFHKLKAKMDRLLGAGGS